jgi:hypothetical protein
MIPGAPVELVLAFSDDAADDISHPVAAWTRDGAPRFPSQNDGRLVALADLLAENPLAQAYWFRSVPTRLDSDEIHLLERAVVALEVLSPNPKPARRHRDNAEAELWDAIERSTQRIATRRAQNTHMTTATDHKPNRT